MFKDLRDFIDTVDRLGDCRVVEGANWDLEIGALSHLLSQTTESPLLLFDKVKGYPPGYRVASNIFATPRRTALALGLPPEAMGIELVKALRDRLKKGVTPIPPVIVSGGPVTQNILTGSEVDLYKFPTPKWHELDGGRYIGTGSMGIMRDPDDGWVNVGVYRTQIHDKSTVTMSMQPGHHAELIRRKYWAKGVPAPVAISCGQEPVVWGAAAWEGIPWGASEYDFAGGLRGAPVEVTPGIVTGLPVPATAEIVLEGEIMPPEVQSFQEGPFGEWCGYYAAGVRTMPAIRIKSIMHRNDPILQGNPPSRLPSVWALARHLQKAAVLWNDLDKQVPGVKGVWMMEEASVHSIVVVSLEQAYAGHAKAAALLAAGSSATNFLCRLVIVVDEDIDPSNTSEVIWALGTRVDPATSIDILRGCMGGASNPLYSPENKAAGNLEMSRGIILAVKPFHWKKDFPASVDVSAPLAAEIRKKWQGMFPQLGK